MTNTTQATECLTTSDIFAATNNALCAKAWSDARLLLDWLVQCQDNRDMFCAPSAYGAPQFIADRIDAVNAEASR